MPLRNQLAVDADLYRVVAGLEPAGEGDGNACGVGTGLATAGPAAMGPVGVEVPQAVINKPTGTAADMTAG
jgi:hypothetical protein